MYLQAEWKTVLKQIKWLHEKPADLDLHFLGNMFYLDSYKEKLRFYTLFILSA